MGDLEFNSGRQTKSDMTFVSFERKLRELVPSSQQVIRKSDRLDTIIPREHRRRVWQQFKAAGFLLPDLTLPPSDVGHASDLRCFLGCFAILFLGPPLLIIMFFAKLLRSSRLGGIHSFLCNQIFPGMRVNQEMAIHPPVGCETVQEAVLHLTRFKIKDYKAGLWPSADLAAKVRQIFSQHSGVPFASISTGTPITELQP
jgi:hypothetical protein